MLECEVTQSSCLTVSINSKDEYSMLSSAATKHIELCKALQDKRLYFQDYKRQDYIFKVINHAVCSQMTAKDRVCEASFDHL